MMLAAASDAIIIGFNVRPLAEARRAAEREGVEIRTYSVIYKVTEDLRAAMEGMLEPEEVEEALGQAEIKELFRASRIGRIAGCLVTDGKITRTAQVRLVREGTIVWTGRIGSLRRFKDNVQEVDEGLECGVVLEGYQDVKVGDVWSCSRPSRWSRRSSSTAPAQGVPLAVRAYVCLVEVRLHLDDSHDLKGKRKVLHSLKAQLRQRFRASVAEVDGHDTWQRTTLVCAWSPGETSTARRQPGAFVEARCPEGCVFERDLFSLADIRG